MHHGQTVNPDRRATALLGTERKETHPFGRFFPAGEQEFEPILLAALGRANGPIDSGDVHNINEGNVPAIFTFLGQFIDHDITLMCPEFELGADVVVDVDEEAPSPEEGSCDPCDPILIRNGRSPLLDLDALFGAGPDGDPQLYDAQGRLRINNTCKDIIRNSGGGTRLINEPRNDENLIIVQVHVLFARFYNVVIDLGGSYPTARNLVTKVYHAIIRHDYLPNVCDPLVVDWVEDNHYPLYQRMKGQLDGTPAIPIEFAGAAFRFGHSQLRQAYAMNGGTKRDLFDLGTPLTVVTSGCGQGLRTSNDLRGNQPVTDATRIDFSLYVGPGAQPARQIDAFLPRALFELPPASIAEPPLSLAGRNLRRGHDFRLPTGQAIAEAIRQETRERKILNQLPGQPGFDTAVPPGSGPDADATLSATDLAIDPEIVSLAQSMGVNIEEHTPLWFYLLREAKIHGNDGDRLGPLGSRIVAETLLGLLSEPIPPGGTAKREALLAYDLGSGAEAPEAKMEIRSSRVLQSAIYPGKEGSDDPGSQDLDDAYKISTVEALVQFVLEKEESKTGE